MAIYRFLLWNTKGRLENLLIANELINEHNIDFLLLCEAHGSDGDIMSRINARMPEEEKYNLLSLEDGKAIIARKEFILGSKSKQFRVSTVRVSSFSLKEIRIILVHFPSMAGKDSKSISGFARIFSRDLEKLRVSSQERIILAGDFNLNPFDEAMVGCDGINACMYASVASGFKNGKVFQDHDVTMMYNPMLEIFKNSEIDGTYYINNGENVCYYWNIFDQFILSRDLINFVDISQSKILDKHNGNSFLDKGLKPDKDNKSDHLPVLMCISL